MKQFQFSLAALILVGLALWWQHSQDEPKKLAEGAALPAQSQLVYQLDNEYRVPLQPTQEQILRGYAYQMDQVAGVLNHIYTVERAKANLPVVEETFRQFDEYQITFAGKLNAKLHPDGETILLPSQRRLLTALATYKAQQDIVSILQPVVSQYE